MLPGIGHIDQLVFSKKSLLVAQDLVGVTHRFTGLASMLDLSWQRLMLGSLFAIGEVTTNDLTVRFSDAEFRVYNVGVILCV